MNNSNSIKTKVINNEMLPAPSFLEADENGFIPWSVYQAGLTVIIPPQPRGNKGDQLRIFLVSPSVTALIEDPAKEQSISVLPDDFLADWRGGEFNLYYWNMTSGETSHLKRYNVEELAPITPTTPTITIVESDGSTIPASAALNGLTFNASKYQDMSPGDTLTISAIYKPPAFGSGYTIKKIVSSEDVGADIHIEYPQSITESLPGARVYLKIALEKNGTTHTNGSGPLNIDYIPEKQSPVMQPLPSWFPRDILPLDKDLNYYYPLSKITEIIDGQEGCRFLAPLTSELKRGEKITLYFTGNKLDFAQTLEVEADGVGELEFFVPAYYIIVFESYLKECYTVLERLDGSLINSNIMFWIDPNGEDLSRMERRSKQAIARQAFSTNALSR